MDTAETALYPMAAMEEAAYQSQEADPARDRKDKGICLGLQRSGALVELRSVAYERCGNCQMVRATGAHEPTCRASTLYEPCMNRRMPNGTYGGVRGWDRKALAYSILSNPLPLSMRIHGRTAGGRSYPLHGEDERQHTQDQDADEEERIGEGEGRGLADELAVEHAVGT